MGFLDKVLGKDKKKSESESANSLTHIFISYSTMDRAIAEGVCNFLESNGLKCWIAPRDVMPNTDYTAEIINALEISNIVVFINSRDTYQSIYIKNELKTALQNKKPIITYKVDDSMPERDWMYIISESRIVNADRDPLNQAHELLPALREEYNSLGLHRVVDMSSFKKDIPSDSGNEPSFKKPFKAYAGNSPYIFISYAHKDADLVFDEIRKFHDAGYPVWYDQGLTPGQEWDDEIARALMNASLLVVFISKNSMASKNVLDEIKMALNRDIDIVPIYLEKIELPPALQLRLSNKHAIFKYLSQDDYVVECFKAFDKAGIPRTKHDGGD